MLTTPRSFALLLPLALLASLAACGGDDGGGNQNNQNNQNPPVCGDGVKADTEPCDGELLGGVTCASLGYTGGTITCTGTCTFDVSGCTSVCGDGAMSPAEGCDDGNAAPGDGCSATCAVETGWTCTGTPSVCTTICGDGLVVGPETCDGTAPAGQDCTDLGYVEPVGITCSDQCTVDTSGCTAVCGNALVEPGEVCDDGNRTEPGVCALPCGAICDTGVVDTANTPCGDCLGASCCAEYTACAQDATCLGCVTGQTTEGCNLSLPYPDAVQCRMDSCQAVCSTGAVCDSGLVVPNPTECGDCLGASCCAEYTACAQDSACLACITGQTTTGCDTNTLLAAATTCMNNNCDALCPF